MNFVTTMSSEDVRLQIKKTKDRHQINKVLHAHPSPMHWRPPQNKVDIGNFKKPKAQLRRINFYMGIPYCIPTDPPHCGFCLFPTEKYEGKDGIDNYLTYLEKEADLYLEFYKDATIESLYVGGGTPNLLSADAYPRLMKIAQKVFPKMDARIEKTLEGIPQLFNEDKIKSIKSSGFNRVSMGVQQMNDRLIKYSGRKQTRKQVFDAIALFHKYDLACNLDLIYGWPEQTTEDMIEDLKLAADSGIRHITHYELNIGGRSDFATEKKSLIASVPQKIEMHAKAKEYLLSRGFVRRTVYDWEKPVADSKFSFQGAENYSYENNLRSVVKVDQDPNLYMSSMGGIGYAAVNIHVMDNRDSFPAVATMNHKSLVKYFEDIAAGHTPIERLFSYKPEDMKLTWIFQCSQEMKVDKQVYREIFGNCLYEEFKSVWQVLEELDWIRNDENEIHFVNDGEFYIPTIQALLSKARIEEISRSQNSGSENR